MHQNGSSMQTSFKQTKFPHSDKQFNLHGRRKKKLLKPTTRENADPEEKYLGSLDLTADRAMTSTDEDYGREYLELRRGSSSTSKRKFSLVRRHNPETILESTDDEATKPTLRQKKSLVTCPVVVYRYVSPPELNSASAIAFIDWNVKQNLHLDYDSDDFSDNDSDVD